MSKSGITAVLAAMLTVSAPMAFAQTSPTPGTVRMSAGATQMAPAEIRASKFIGSTVYDAQNQNLGSVKDLLFAHDGGVQAAIVDVGAFLGMGGKYVAVGLNDIKTDNNRLTLSMTKDQLKAAPEFKFNDTNTIGMSTGTSASRTNASGTSLPPANR